MEENQEIKFARTLEEVRRLAKEQQNCISEQQVREAFQALDLTEAHLEMVFDYLKKHRIGIGEPADPDEYLSPEEIDYLEAYKREIEELGRISEGEREAVTLRAMAGERGAQHRLTELYLPRVAEISRLYSGQGVLVEDLIGEGNVALSAGVSMLGCLEHPGEAEEMLVKLIMDAMECCIEETVRENDKDRKVAAQVNKVARKAEKLARELNRKVTSRELAEETGMSLKSIEDAMRMSGFSIEDLERQ